MPIDVRKTLTDAGYVTIGIGVLGYQQAQVRRRDLQSRLGERLGSTGGCLNSRAADGKARLDTLQKTVTEKTQRLRDTIETQARTASDWAQEIGSQVKERIEPVVGQVVDQVGTTIRTLPNRAA